jgi:predicted N-formylglutamate amidohydrolase
VPLADLRIVFTCEHGGNRVPKEFASLFVGSEKRLASHRGWDPGALETARLLARSMRAPLVAATTTRLLVDLNRSPENRRVFSDWTRALPRPDRDELLARFHEPHWRRVREQLQGGPAPTLHIAVHSFTPVLSGVPRAFAVGLLYDPSRTRERRLAIAWQRALRDRLSTSDVRRNAPYRGDSDGLTTALRKDNIGSRYLGIELELNQSRLGTPEARRTLGRLLAESLRVAVASVR